MALDPAAAGLLEQMADAGLPALNELSPAEARVAAAGFAELGGPGDEVANVEDRTIPGPAGPIPVRIYTPDRRHGAPSRPRLLPRRRLGHRRPRDGRRHLPVPSPTGPSASWCRSTTAWRPSTSSRRRSTTATPPSPGWPSTPPRSASTPAVSPSAATAPAATSAPPSRCGPATRAARRCGCSCSSTRSPTTASTPSSYKENGEGYLLTKDMMVWFWDHYLGNAGDGDNPLASPLRARTCPGCRRRWSSPPSSIRCATRARRSPPGWRRPACPSPTPATTARSTASGRCWRSCRRPSKAADEAAAALAQGLRLTAAAARQPGLYTVRSRLKSPPKPVMVT